jgi:hypothetical protein
LWTVVQKSPSATKDTALVAAFAAYKPDLIIPKPLDPALLPF